MIALQHTSHHPAVLIDKTARTKRSPSSAPAIALYYWLIRQLEQKDRPSAHEPSLSIIDGVEDGMKSEGKW